MSRISQTKRVFEATALAVCSPGILRPGGKKTWLNAEAHRDVGWSDGHTCVIARKCGNTDNAQDDVRFQQPLEGVRPCRQEVRLESPVHQICLQPVAQTVHQTGRPTLDPTREAHWEDQAALEAEEGRPDSISSLKIGLDAVGRRQEERGVCRGAIQTAFDLHSQAR